MDTAEGLWNMQDGSTNLRYDKDKQDCTLCNK